MGPVDALINGAGPYHRVSLLQETLEGWHSMFDNNLHPVFYLTRAVIPIMKELQMGTHRQLQYGQRRAANRPTTAHGALSKHIALLALSRSFAKLIAVDGITMNCVSPGFIDQAAHPRKKLGAWSNSFRQATLALLTTPYRRCASCCRKRRAMSTVPTSSSAAHGVSRRKCRKRDHSLNGRNPWRLNRDQENGALELIEKAMKHQMAQDIEDAIRLYKDRSRFTRPLMQHVSGLGL